MKDNLNNNLSEPYAIEKALKESEENMRYIIKHDPNAIAVYDCNLHYIAVSERYLHDYNVKEENIIGKHHYEVFPEMPQRWKDVHQRCLAGAIECDDDDYFDRPDGSVTYNRWECRPWYRVNGEIGGIITYTEVTTERKKAENALKETNNKLVQAQRVAKIGSWENSLVTNDLQWSEEMYHILGFPPNTSINLKEAARIFPPEEIVRFQQAVSNAIDKDAPYSMDYKIIRLDGSVRYIHDEGEVVRDDQGQAISMIGTTQDITERKLAEKKLNHITRMYALLSQINHAIVQIKDQDELFLKICRVAIDFGQFRMAWIGLADEAEERLKPIVHAGHEDGYLDGIVITIDPQINEQGPSGLAFREGKIFTSTDIATDPNMLPWRDEALQRGYRSSAAVPFRRKGKIIGTLTLYASDSGFFTNDEQSLLHEIGEDISFSLDAMDSETERNTAEKALFESEIKYRAFFENSLDAIIFISSDGKIYSANQAACSMFGYSEEELSKLDRSAIADSTDPRLSVLFAERKLKGKAQGEATFIRKDGTHFPADISAVIFRDHLGNECISIILRDITERKQKEASLLKLNSAVEQTHDSIVITDHQGNIEYVNNAFEVLTGYSSDEAMGKTPRILKSGLRDREYYEAMWNTILSGNVFREEVMNKKKNGDLFYEQKTISPIFDKNRTITHFVGTGIDITKSKLTEEALLESEKLYRNLFENMLNGFAYCKMIFEQEQPVDFIYLAVNKSFEIQTGLKDIAGKKVSEVIPGIQKSDTALLEVFGRVALTGKPETIEIYVEGLKMWFSISVYSPRKEYFVALFDVITSRKNAGL